MKPGTKRKTWAFSVLLCMAAYVLAAQAKLRPALAEELGAGEKPVLGLMEKEAHFYFFLEDYLNAATHFKRLEKASESTGDKMRLNHSRFLLGSLYLSWGMHQSASRIFQGLLDAFPEGENRNAIFLAIERMQYRRAQYRSLLDTFQTLELRPPFHGVDEATYLAGMSHYAMGEMEAGNAELLRILPESRFYPFAQLALAKSYIFLNDVPKSLRIFEKLSRFDSGQDRFVESLIEKSRLTWGQLLIEVKRHSRAYAVLSEISPESPFYPDALFGMAWARFKDTDYLTAILIFQDLVDLQPEHDYALEALTALGHAYNRLEAYPKAIDYYTNAISVYGAAEKAILTFLDEIENPQHLAGFISQENYARSRIFAELAVEDDGVRYWISQYQALEQLKTVLAKKKRDMEVYEVVANHREVVFRDAMHKTKADYSSDVIDEKKNKLATLKMQLEQAIQNEQHVLLLTVEENNILNQLSQARKKSVAIQNRVAALAQKNPEINDRREFSDLKTNWQKTHRWLGIALGEQHWNIGITLPGRVDDLKRAMRRLDVALDELDESHAELQKTLPALEAQVETFRDRITSARQKLEEKHKETIGMQQAILPALKKKLVEASGRRMKRLAAWTAAAELSQLQILDVKGLN